MTLDVIADLVTLARVALLAPVAAFLLIAALPFLRRSGTPAALVSIAAVLVSFGSAVMLWWLSNGAFANGAEPVRHVWNWLPGATGPLAVMGVLVDHQSSLM